MSFPGDLVTDVGSESSTRGRSFLFFALGIFAGSGLGSHFVLRVPENGLIALTLQNPEDDDGGQALLRRAQRFGSFVRCDRMRKFGWQAELVASGPHPDVHITEFTRTRVPGYAVLNLSADYALAPGWKLTGRLTNALDADYALVHGYATPGRQFRVELAYAPK